MRMQLNFIILAAFLLTTLVSTSFANVPLVRRFLHIIQAFLKDVILFQTAQIASKRATVSLTPLAYAEAFRKRHCAQIAVDELRVMLETPFEDYLPYLTAVGTSKSLKCFAIKRYVCAKAFVTLEMAPKVGGDAVVMTTGNARRFFDAFMKDVQLFTNFCVTGSIGSHSRPSNNNRGTGRI